MKKLTLLAFALSLSVGIFAQVAKYQPKLVAVFMGEKNQTFDENRFSDVNCYYIPEMKIIESENKNTTTKSVMSGLGVDRDEEMQEFEGKPEGMIYRRNMILAFDKNGILAGSGKMSKDLHLDKIPLTIGKNMGNFEYTNLAELSKQLIKKDKPMKAGKKMKAKKPRVYDYVTFNVPDFEVSDSEGNKTTINTIVKDSQMTVVVFIYLDNDFNTQAGTENGAGFESTVQTVAAEKQLKLLVKIEEEIFGKKVNL
ncbi:MAG: hypothetical protein JEY96_18030 [Bacteroidales bacterium]|nr:hypothetical protein [Bacteroidales bacterium]